MTIQQALELARQHHSSGRLAEAGAIYRQILGIYPGHTETLANLVNLGTSLLSTGNVDQAVAAYRQALVHRPVFPDAWYNLGIALRAAADLQGAIDAFQHAAAQNPQHPQASNNLAVALLEAGRVGESLSSSHRAVELDPKSAEAYNNLGNALRAKGELADAVVAYQHATMLQPTLAEAHNNLATALLENRRHAEAVSSYQQALALRPNWAAAHYNLGLALLSLGGFRQGWIEHEWRFQIPEMAATFGAFTQPLWDGSALRDRRILIHAEQAFGDTIQFVRFIPLVAQRGGKVILQCHAELERLMHALDGPERVIARGRELPPFDLHCPLLSLPRLFATTLENVPRSVPYLRADATASARCRQRIPNDRLKIGLCWTGRVVPNPRRSIPAERLDMLNQVPGSWFVSLQKEEGAIGDEPSLHLPLARRSWPLEDFADTAALIDNLDLVVTIDTAVAHLAGAMGKPVWIILPYVPDWRWMLDRSDSPWYPTARLFRQRRNGDWDTPMSEVVQALKDWSRSQSKGAEADGT